MEDSIFKLGGFVLAITGALFARDKYIIGKISKGDEMNAEKIDGLKDTVNADFARKDDMRDSVKRVERSVENLGTELRGQHNQIMELLMNKMK